MITYKFTILNCLKIFAFSIIFSKLITFIFTLLADIFNLIDLMYLSFDIGQIITVIFIIIYLYKNSDLNLKLLLFPNKILCKEFVIMLLMLFSGYIVINLITNAIINILHIIEPVLESDNEICEISPITSYIFFIGITIISPIIEEFFFRGLFLIKLKDNCNPIFALIFSSLMFCCLHYYGYGQISAFITALLLGIIALKTNTIFYTIIGHILFNLLTTIFGIVSDHSNIINIINRTFHFNIVINIASIIIFIITCFILLKFQLNKKHIPYIK